MVNDADNNSVPSKAKSRKEVADDYGISGRTLNRWLKKANLEISGGLIDPFHLKIIYNAFGTPRNHKVT